MQLANRRHAGGGTRHICDHCGMSRDTPASPSKTSLLVACLCAQWCGTCRDFQPLFMQLQADFPQARFVWVDVEDESDLVDPIEVENFPTLMIARQGQPLFFGTITPHLETLRRLIQNHQAATPAPGTPDADVAQLVQRLTARLNA